jgi:hypothetical protein
MQASCAVLGLLSSVVAWRDGAIFWWVVGRVLLGSVIPFTLIVILPTNKRLLSVTLDKRQSKRNVCSHGGAKLYAVRSVLSGLALLLFLYLALFRDSL